MQYSSGKVLKSRWKYMKIRHYWWPVICFQRFVGFEFGYRSVCKLWVTAFLKLLLKNKGKKRKYACLSFKKMQMPQYLALKRQLWVGCLEVHFKPRKVLESEGKWEMKWIWKEQKKTEGYVCTLALDKRPLFRNTEWTGAFLHTFCLESKRAPFAEAVTAHSSTILSKNAKN